MPNSVYEVREVNMVDKQCKSTDYITPPDIIEKIKIAFGGEIGLDPATTIHNPVGAKNWCATPFSDGLKWPWGHQGGVFVNPPYGKVLHAWVHKICMEAMNGTAIIALLPGQRFETKIWQELLLPHPRLNYLTMLRGRVQFLLPDGSSIANSNPYGSMLYVFNSAKIPNVAMLQFLGHMIKISDIGR